MNPKETEPLIKIKSNQTLQQTTCYRTVISETDNKKTAYILNKQFSKPELTGNSNFEKEFAFEDDKLVTYTWSNIDVYSILKDKKCWGQLFRKKSSMDIKKHLLRDVSGVAYPGELLVIMGPSGAGKTTLLNVLTSQSNSDIVMSGNVAINGKKLDSNILTSQIAYVQQNDLFIGTLTVEEHLYFQALVRMNRDIPYYHRMQRVNEVISELALTKCKDTIIGIAGRLKGISGGEMKRLSFASEVLTDPPLMLCDEPTSGLDSYMAHQVVTILKTLAAKGKTIITTLHQPSSELYNMFDKILLLAEGRVAFSGTSEEAIEFFKSLGALCPSNYNPADYFIQLLAIVPERESACRHSINSVCDKFKSSSLGMKIILEIHKINFFENNLYNDDRKVFRNSLIYKANWLEQFRAVLWRSWLSVIKEPILMRVRILQTIMVAILIGIMYYNQKLDQDGAMNINGALFIFLTNMTFQNVFAVINVFCSELPIFIRENKNGMYRADVYFICKTIAETPIFIAVPLIFTAITYPMIGLYPGTTHFISTAGVIVLVANVATSFGYLISCTSKDISMALSIGPPIIIPFLLFGGFFLNSASVPVYFKWMSYFSWFRYGNEALLINQWADVEFIACTRGNITCPKSGLTLLQTLNFDKDFFWKDIMALILLIIIFRIIAFLALVSKTFKK